MKYVRFFFTIIQIHFMVCVFYQCTGNGQSETNSEPKRATDSPSINQPVAKDSIKESNAIKIKYYFQFFAQIEEYESRNDAGELVKTPALMTYTIRYPQVFGLANVKVQASLNEILQKDFKNRLTELIADDADSEQRQKMSYRDSSDSDKKELKPDKALSQKLEKIKEKGEWTDELMECNISLVDQRFANIEHYSSMDGNMAAHPTFYGSSYVIDLQTGNKVTLRDIF